VNGAYPSAGTGITKMFGVFNPYLPFTVSWLPVNQGEKYYRVAVATAANNHVYDQAAALTGQSETMDIPPGALSDAAAFAENASIMHISARKQDPTRTPVAEIRARSQQFELHSGLNGSVNWRYTGSTSKLPDIIVDVSANPQGTVLVCNSQTVAYTCDVALSYLTLPQSAANSYATLHLVLSDGTLAHSLDLYFADSASASGFYDNQTTGTAFIAAPVGPIN